MSTIDFITSYDYLAKSIDLIEEEYKLQPTVGLRRPHNLDTKLLLVDVARMIYRGNVIFHQELEGYRQSSKDKVINLFNSDNFLVYVSNTNKEINYRIGRFYGRGLSPETLATVKMRHAVENVLFNKSNIITLNPENFKIDISYSDEEKIQMSSMLSSIHSSIQVLENIGKNISVGVSELLENQDSFCCQANTDSGGVSPSFTP